MKALHGDDPSRPPGSSHLPRPGARLPGARPEQEAMPDAGSRRPTWPRPAIAGSRIPGARSRPAGPVTAGRPGVPWMVLAAVLWATGPRDRWARRAAWRGLGSLAAASVTANVVAKGLSGRRRRTSRFPRQAAATVPRSRPSVRARRERGGVRHGVGDRETIPGRARHRPCRGGECVPGATGVDYLSDVLAGIAIGAMAGVMTLRWWPAAAADAALAMRPPADPPPAAEACALPRTPQRERCRRGWPVGWRRNCPRPRSSRRAPAGPVGAAAPRCGTSTDTGVAGGDGTVRAARRRSRWKPACRCW